MPTSGTRSSQADAETASDGRTQFYQFEIDTTAVSEVWRRGSVIEFLAVRLLPRPFSNLPSSRNSRVGYRTPVKAAGPRSRQLTRVSPLRCSPARSTRAFPLGGSMNFADKVLSAMRKGFGGHDEKKT